MTQITCQQPEFWQVRYQEHQTPWDLGGVAPPFVSLLEKQDTPLKPGKMAVLGCGYGHDAAYFGQHGFAVTGFDFAPEAIAAAQQRYGAWGTFVQADIFQLPSSYAEAFDTVLEHTCFCAIRPNQREAYVQVVHGLLKPGGCFVGLFWAHQELGGPPYKTNAAEIGRLFSPYFHIASLAQAQDSVPERAGEELLGIFYRF